jgi:hypothetical protein
LPYLHLAAHKPRGPGFAAAAVDASLRSNHKAAIALARPAVSAIAKVGRQAPAFLPSCGPLRSPSRKAIYVFAKAALGYAPVQPSP